MRTSSKIGAGIAAALGLGLLFVMVSFWGGSLGTTAAVVFKKSFILLLPVLIGVAGAVLVGMSSNRSRYGDPMTTAKSVVGGVMVVGGVIGFLVVAVLLAPWTLMQYGDDISAVDEPVPSFAQRAPYQQAEALLSRNKGGVQGTSTRPMYLGDKWSIVVGGDGTGIRSYGVVEWDGKGESPDSFVRCQFGADTPGVYGALWNSLVREARFSHGIGAYDLDPNDFYGFCDGDQAVMVLPVTRYVGVAPTKRVAAGVLLVRSGDDISYVADVEAGTVPGPVYPESLVSDVEYANASRDGALGDVVFVRANYLKPDLEAGENPNSRNTGQFMLTGGDGQLYAVTPLVLANSGGNQVVAVGVTNVSYNKNGTVNPLTIYRLPQPRRANAEIANLVKSEFATLPWYSGLNVMEVIPVTDDLWVGYIGRDVSPEYRFTIDKSNTICVYNASTGVLSGCSNTVDPAVEEDTATRVEDLSVLSNEDLLKIRDRVDAEFDRRLLSQESSSQASAG